MDDTFAADVTARFQEVLPYALLPASPALAALHTTRVRLRFNNSDQSPSIRSVCTKCGSNLFADNRNGKVRTFRSRQPKGSKTQVLRKTCGRCHAVDDATVEKVNIASFPTRTPPIFYPTDTIPSGGNSEVSMTRSQQDVMDAPLSRFSLDRSYLPTSTRKPADLPSWVQQSPAPPSDDMNASIRRQSKSRPKKKSGLQDLLARNRQKEEAERLRKSDGQAGGLTDFLSGL